MNTGFWDLWDPSPGALLLLVVPVKARPLRPGFLQSFFYVCWSRESVCIPYFGLFRSLNIKILMMIDDDWWWYWMILDYNPWIFYSKPRANIFPGAKEIGFAVLIVVCCALLHLQRLLELPPGLHFWRFLALRIEPDGSWLKSTHRQTALTNLWAIHRLHHVPFT